MSKFLYVISLLNLSNEVKFSSFSYVIIPHILLKGRMLFNWQEGILSLINSSSSENI